jgi:hypothetical protein
MVGHEGHQQRASWPVVGISPLSERIGSSAKLSQEALPSCAASITVANAVSFIWALITKVDISPQQG